MDARTTVLWSSRMAWETDSAVLVRWQMVVSGHRSQNTGVPPERIGVTDIALQYQAALAALCRITGTQCLQDQRDGVMPTLSK